ncbi:WD40 repeat-like protein [Auriculariales sp. MPI-PUGE-AT-0066]|nr:WD40 repeat-like protein [Auriculariales sp. MPI-PUGE-AT-0066]
MHRPHGNMIRDIHWSTDDTQLLSAGADGFARISQVETQTTTHQFSHSFALHSVSFDPNNESVVCTVGRDKRICIWDMRNSSRTADGFREPVLTISPCSSKSATSITSALYLPHEPQRIVTSWSSNGILKKWDLRYLSSVDELSLPSTLQDPVEESAVDPTTTGAQRPRGISHLVYNERTRLIYSLAVNGRIYAHEPYLEAPSPSTLLSTYGHSGVSGTKDSFYVRMSISSCGRWLASGSSEGQAYVYALDGRPAHPFVQDRAAYQRGVVLNLHQDEVHGLDWAKDTLALASDDQMVSLWRHDEEVGKKCREDSEAQNWNWTWATRE